MYGKSIFNDVEEARKMHKNRRNMNMAPNVLI
jgi:hypothetical protein